MNGKRRVAGVTLLASLTLWLCGCHTIFEGVRKHDIGAVRSFILHDPNVVNKRDYYGETPLIVAVKLGEQDMVKLLLDKGVDMEARDDMGRTALHWAARNGWKDICALLLARGADPNPIGKFGATPLDLAFEIDPELAAIIRGYGGRESGVSEENPEGTAVSETEQKQRTPPDKKDESKSPPVPANEDIKPETQKNPQAQKKTP